MSLSLSCVVTSYLCVLLYFYSFIVINFILIYTVLFCYIIFTHWCILLLVSLLFCIALYCILFFVDFVHVFNLFGSDYSVR